MKNVHSALLQCYLEGIDILKVLRHKGDYVLCFYKNVCIGCSFLREIGVLKMCWDASETEIFFGNLHSIPWSTWVFSKRIGLYWIFGDQATNVELESTRVNIFWISQGNFRDYLLIDNDEQNWVWAWSDDYLLWSIFEHPIPKCWL